MLRLPDSRSLHEAPPRRVKMPDSSTSPGFFQVILQITEAGLHLADGLLDLALQLQLFVADQLAGGFLDIAFCFVDTSLDLILVYEFLLKVEWRALLCAPIRSMSVR